MGRSKQVFKFLLYITFFPFTIIYWASKSQAGKLAKIIVILIGLFLLPVWLVVASAFFMPSKYSKPQDESTPQETPSPTPTPLAEPEQIEETFKVSRVIDGDTIKLKTGESLRYIGIDTPESGCFAAEATAKNKELVEGKEVRLEKDVSETDKYDRLLRYVYIDDILVNDYLVRNGYAHVATFPPDVKYQDQFLEAEREARENNRGLWAENVCVTPSPAVKSAVTTSPQPTNPPPQTSTGGCKYSCSGPDRDCADFATQAEAQTFFNCCGFTATYDPMQLDSLGVGDGIPCESLP